MKNTHFIALLILLPSIVLADGGLEGIPILLTFISVLIITGILGLISVFYYLKTKSKLSFKFAAISATFLLTVFIVYTLLSDKRMANTFGIYLTLPSLFIFTALLSNKLKTESPSLFAYYLLNITTILLIGNIVHLLKINTFGFIFHVINGFCVFIYARKSMKKPRLSKLKSVYIDSNLICLLSFCTITLFYLFVNVDLTDILSNLILNINQTLFTLLIMIIISNLVVFAAIKTTANSALPPGGQGSIA